MKKFLILASLAFALFVLPGTARAAEAWETQQIPYDVESGVICTLDKCYKNLTACDSSASEVLRGVIREKLFKEGLTKEQTFTYLAQTYGEDVLAAPPKKGFNWLAWITPFVIAIAGGVFVYSNLGRWVTPKKEKPILPNQLDSVYEDHLSEELKKYI